MSRRRFVVPLLCGGTLVAVVLAAVWQANRNGAPPAPAYAPQPVDRDALTRDLNKCVEELKKSPTDWRRFERTATDRKRLAEALPESRDALVKAEEEWLLKTFAIESCVTRCDPGIPLPPGTDYRNQEKMVLALPAVDTSEGRFKEARRQLFVLAHREIASLVEEYHKTKHFHRAFGIARRHAVDWNATATLLGPTEVAKLDALRKKCAVLANPDVPDPDPEGDPDIAPPPRPKQ